MYISRSDANTQVKEKKQSGEDKIKVKIKVIVNAHLSVA